MVKEQLLLNMPDYYVNSDLVANILNAYARQFKKLTDKYDNANKQLSINTADTDLYKWEEDFGIITNLSEDIEKRRRKVLAKMQTKSMITPEKLKLIIKSYTGVDVSINEITEEYMFYVTLVSNKAFNVDLSEIGYEMDQIKPAHLAYTLALETHTYIRVNATREYVFNPLNMCGEFMCGDGIVISAYGRTYESTLKSHVDYSKNIKDYDLSGTILPSLNAEFENGIAIIGRSYESNENIKVTRDYLYDNQLSKTGENIIGTVYNSGIKATASYNNSINNYEEAGSDLTGQFITGSNETLISTLGMVYESNENIESQEKVILDTQLNKSSSTDPIVGSLNSSVIEATTSSEEAIKDYSKAGSILVSENIDSENGDATIGKTYSCDIQETSNETSSIKEYNQTGEILTSTEVVL